MYVSHGGAPFRPLVIGFPPPQIGGSLLAVHGGLSPSLHHLDQATYGHRYVASHRMAYALRVTVISTFALGPA